MKWIWFTLLFPMFAAVTQAGERWLVEKGEPRGEIVIAEKPTRMQQLAAEELRDGLRKITGAELLIVHKPTPQRAHVFVGHSAAAEALGLPAERLQHGAFRIASGEDWLALIGEDADFVPGSLHSVTVSDRARVRAEFTARTGDRWAMPVTNMDRRRHAETGWWQDDERGSLNAVHDFLRSLGMRWFMPGELGEVVPYRESVALPTVNRVVRPDLAVRHFDCNRWDLVSREEILWHFRQGLNWSGNELGHGRRHGLQAVLASPEMKRDHPEYYALWGGKRQTDYLTDGAPCLSSEGLLQEHVRYARAMLDLFDEAALDVAIPDNYGKTGRMCECERCQSRLHPERAFGSLSDLVWDYMSRLAQEVGKTHPNKRLIAYAYQSTFLPPQDLAALPPNLAVIMASGGRDLRQFPDRLPAGKRDMDSIHAQWAAKVTSGALYTWDYYLHARPAVEGEGGQVGVPVLFPHSIAADLRQLGQLQPYRGEYVECARFDTTAPSVRGQLAAASLTHLNLYLTARLYWDTKADVDSLLTDYCEQFYGPAAKPMRAFIDHAEQHWPAMTGTAPDRTAIATTKRLLEAARDAAPSGSVYAKRIEWLADELLPFLAK